MPTHYIGGNNTESKRKVFCVFVKLSDFQTYNEDAVAIPTSIPTPILFSIFLNFVRCYRTKYLLCLLFTLKYFVMATRDKIIHLPHFQISRYYYKL
jgi:hypothetical protein